MVLGQVSGLFSEIHEDFRDVGVFREFAVMLEKKTGCGGIGSFAYLS